MKGICSTVTSRADEATPGSPRSASPGPPSSLSGKRPGRSGASACVASPVDITMKPASSSGNGTRAPAASPVPTGLPAGGSEMTWPSPVKKVGTDCVPGMNFPGSTASRMTVGASRVGVTAALAGDAATASRPAPTSAAQGAKAHRARSPARVTCSALSCSPRAPRARGSCGRP